MEGESGTRAYLENLSAIMKLMSLQHRCERLGRK